MARLSKQEKNLELARRWSWVCDALTSKQFFKAEPNWGLSYESKIKAVRAVTKSKKVLLAVSILENFLNEPTAVELEALDGGRLMTGVPRAKLSLVG